MASQNNSASTTPTAASSSVGSPNSFASLSPRRSPQRTASSQQQRVLVTSPFGNTTTSSRPAAKALVQAQHFSRNSNFLQAPSLNHSGSSKGHSKPAPTVKLRQRLLFAVILSAFFLQFHLNRLLVGLMSDKNNDRSSLSGSINKQHKEPRCAILLWGLPRAFDSLVLPSLRKNIIAPNAPYNCDYFIHYFHLKEEAAGRSGSGGAIHPEQVLDIRQHVIDAATGNPSRTPLVNFDKTTEEEFIDQYQGLLDTIHTTIDETTGKYRYFPWKAKTYRHPVTTTNIVKMWHTIQSAWRLMERSTASNVEYTTVAMLRSDVVYVTPIDVFEYSPDKRGGSYGFPLPPSVVTVPGFGRYPVSDRIVVGPAAAVKVWATERFSRLEQHIRTIDAGWGLHSERFVNWTLFPAMRNALDNENAILAHPHYCFFRARADETVWVSDCAVGDATVSLPSIAAYIREHHGTYKHAVEDTLGRDCWGKVYPITRTVRVLNCTKM